jgi:hypothetical protein
METIMDYPLLMSAGAFLGFWGAAHLGASIRTKSLDDDDRSDWSVIEAATMTLLALIIGFSFSMAITRYDQRKNLEAEEANAIGTEYLRLDLLTPADAAKGRALLKHYVDQRVLFYITRDEEQLGQINRETVDLQERMWALLQPASTAQPTPPMALVISGMNDVLNSSAYTTAAWLNRIPVAAWVLMVIIALCCNVLVGYCAHRNNGSMFVILPLVVAISFLLIADIDSPRGGKIHVKPLNLVDLSQYLHAH